MEVAREEGVPPYVVASDRTLRDIALLRPINSDELKRVIEQLVAHVKKLTQELHNLQSICANQQQNLQSANRVLSDLDTKLQKEEQRRILAGYNSDHMDKLVRDAPSSSRNGLLGTVHRRKQPFSTPR